MLPLLYLSKVHRRQCCRQCCRRASVFSTWCLLFCACILLPGCRADQPAPGAAGTTTDSSGASMAAAEAAAPAARRARGAAFAASSAPITPQDPPAAVVSLRDLPPIQPLPAVDVTMDARDNTGIIVFAPRPKEGTASSVADFGDGCAFWVLATVGGHPELGRTPLLTSIGRARAEMKKSDMRLSPSEAIDLAKRTGASHVATAEIEGTPENCTIVFTLHDVNTGNPIDGEAAVVAAAGGTRDAVLGKLPEVSRQLARRLGVAEPRVPDSVGLGAAEMERMGRVAWGQRGAREEWDFILSAAKKDISAAVLSFVVNQFVRNSDFDAAMDAALKLSPDNAFLWSTLGWMYEAALVPRKEGLLDLRRRFPRSYQLAHTALFLHRVLSDHKAHRAAADAAVKNSPQNPDAWLALSYTLQQQGSALRRGRFAADISAEEWQYLNAVYEQQETAAKRATTLAPDYGSAWQRLAEAATFSGNPELADQAFWKAHALLGNDPGLLSWGLQMYHAKWGGDPQTFEKVARLSANATYRRVFDAIAMTRALKTARFNDLAKELLDKTIASAKAAAQSDPSSVRAHYDLSLAYTEAGEHSKAASSLEAAAKLRPDDSLVSYELGRAYNRFFEREKAEAALRRTLEIDPEHKLAHIDLGFTLMVRGKLDEAEKVLKTAVLLLPYNRNAHFTLADVYLAQRRFPEAVTKLEDVVRLGGSGALVYEKLTYAAYRAKDLKKAIHWGEEGARRYGRQSDSMLAALAYAYLEAKRYPEAVETNKAAIALNPKNAMAQENLGLTYNAMGKRNEARAQWELVLKLNNDPGQMKEAREMLKKYPPLKSAATKSAPAKKAPTKKAPRENPSKKR